MKSHELNIQPKNLQIDLSFFASYGTHFMNCVLRLWGFLYDRDGGRRDKKITASLNGFYCTW